MTTMTHSCGTLTLHFASDGNEEDQLRGQLSGVVHAGGHLWLASDEANSVERLSRNGGGEFGKHRTFRLADYLDLPGGEEEIDIEGLDYDGGYLWLVGSHGLKRRKGKADGNAGKQIERMAELRADGNRYLVARIPLVADDAGELTPSKEHDGEEGPLLAARLMGSDRGNLLTEVLRMDEHLAPFLTIPSKDNGFDVEGIAVRGDRVFLGLRGPVLRGWAVILEIRLEDAGSGLLALGALEGSERPYRKHFLDLRGLGVRDLCLDGSDLLILAGPTMDLDGPAAVYRWSDALDVDEEVMVGREELDEVMEVAYGTGEHDASDHPEGLALYASDDGKPDHLLVVCDSPDAHRLHGESGVRGDLFPLRK
jgi:hypothetical protein